MIISVILDFLEQHAVCSRVCLLWRVLLHNQEVVHTSETNVILGDCRAHVYFSRVEIVVSAHGVSHPSADK